MSTDDFGRIIVGFDGSEPAIAALDRGLTLAERLGARSTSSRRGVGR
ncbi:universal stress protein [Curtobacterium flaccumfaciens]|nr:universal stress protein [Curtobacterium flaccumfaciens]